VERSPADLPGASALDLISAADRAAFQQALLDVRDSRATRLEVGLDVGDGRVVWARIAHTARVGDAGVPVGALAMVADVTEQKSIEAQLQQAQKLDAVGQLAGGLAHDFNHLLTVIDGYAALLITEADETTGRDLAMIRDAAGRASALTRQLLTFSRAQTAQPQVIDVSTVVTSVETLLRRLIREDVDLVVTATSAPTPVRADPGQLEQVLVNLAINARDAMPAGGTLAIRTDRVLFDGGRADDRADDRAGDGSDEAGAQPDSGAGDHVLITVADTGCGMTPQVVTRIFEPFFTTKDQGKGTGLGLSTVYGIVIRAGGHVRVDTQPGAGTTFKVYLPAAAVAAEIHRSPDRHAVQRLTAGTGTILLVEDDPAVRQLAERILITAGYRVLIGVDGEHALVVARAHADIYLLLTDVIMPGRNSLKHADRLAERQPGRPGSFR
jgi:signal transduction histidine kinase